MENLDPPPPKIKDGKMARFCPLSGFILDLGDGGLLFHFIVSKIADETTCHANFQIHERNPIVFSVQKKSF